jgi:hypothetical protein
MEKLALGGTANAKGMAAAAISFALAGAYRNYCVRHACLIEKIGKSCG